MLGKPKLGLPTGLFQSVFDEDYILFEIICSLLEK